MRLKKILKCLWESFVNTIFEAGVILLPAIYGLILFLYDKWNGWSILWRNGEFFIYSAAFSAPVLLEHIFKKERKAPLLLVIFAIIVFIISLVCYVAMAPSNMTNELEVSVYKLKFFSLTLLLASFVIVFIFKFLYLKPEIMADSADEINRENIAEIKDKLKV